MQEIPEEDFRPVPESFTDLKLKRKAALRTPVFGGLLEKADTGLRSQGLRGAIDLQLPCEFWRHGRPKQTLR
jgi:hypothetical protein